jgi:hypothetical protein
MKELKSLFNLLEIASMELPKDKSPAKGTK